MTNSRLLVLGVLLSAGAFVAASGCGDDTTDTSAGTAGAGNVTTSTGSPSSTGTGASFAGGGGAGTSSGGGGAGTGGMSSATCDSYCTDIMANCTGDANSQYGSVDTCKAVCAVFDPGADMAANSLGCHAYHAGAPSMGMPDMHCGHAGPTGNTVCGATPCDDFCEDAVKLCTGNNEQWADKTACMTDCDMFPKTPTYSASVQSGDSFACRMYHLTAASTAPMVHCKHIALVSDACN